MVGNMRSVAQLLLLIGTIPTIVCAIDDTSALYFEHVQVKNFTFRMKLPVLSTPVVSTAECGMKCSMTPGCHWFTMFEDNDHSKTCEIQGGDKPFLLEEMEDDQVSIRLYGLWIPSKSTAFRLL